MSSSTPAFSAADFTRALEIDVELEPIPADQVLSGAPRSGSAELGELNGIEFGVWEHSPGTSTDVEVEEVFIVLAGRATLSFEGGSSIELAPGVVGRLREGQRTIWTVTETLRKVYLSP